LLLAHDFHSANDADDMSRVTNSTDFTAHSAVNLPDSQRGSIKVPEFDSAVIDAVASVPRQLVSKRPATALSKVGKMQVVRCGAQNGV